MALSIEYTKEDENLFRVERVVYDELLPRLREYFQRKWNGQRQQGTPAWSDSPNDGKALQLKLKSQWRKSGKTMEWDLTCVLEAILALNLGKEEDIFDGLRKTRNKLYHRYRRGLHNSVKNTIFTTIKSAYRNLGWPVNGVVRIETAAITNKDMKLLQAQLEREKRKALKENQENINTLRKKVKTFVGRTKELEELTEKLSEGDSFLIITGGHCYGNAS